MPPTSVSRVTVKCLMGVSTGMSGRPPTRTTQAPSGGPLVLVLVAQVCWTPAGLVRGPPSGEQVAARVRVTVLEDEAGWAPARRAGEGRVSAGMHASTRCVRVHPARAPRSTAHLFSPRDATPRATPGGGAPLPQQRARLQWPTRRSTTSARYSPHTRPSGRTACLAVVLNSSTACTAARPHTATHERRMAVVGAAMPPLPDDAKPASPYATTGATPRVPSHSRPARTRRQKPSRHMSAARLHAKSCRRGGA